MKIKDVKRELGIKNKDLARMFGYANVNSYQKSAGKKRIEKGIVELYQKFRDGKNKD